MCPDNHFLMRLPSFLHVLMKIIKNNYVNLRSLFVFTDL